MTLFGKSLVVAILTMSLLFLGFSVAVWATHVNWQIMVLRKREEAKPGQPAGLKYQLEDARKIVTEEKAQFDKLQLAIQTEEPARRAQLAKLETMRAALKAEYDQMVSALGGLKESERNSVEAAQKAQEELANKLQEIDELQKQTEDAYAERDSRFKESIALTDKLHEAEDELARLKSNAKMLKRQIEVMTGPKAADANPHVFR
ncbi:MAG TPA: hypothetical protein VFI31_10725 [Pirellulales bacterium]|nr:hypothetical protein [Pirellulales bacterium]